MACDEKKKLLGLTKCANLPKMPKSMFETGANFVIPAATIAAGQQAVLDYLQDALVAAEVNRIYKYPNFFKQEDQSDETTYEKTPLGKKKVLDPNYSFKFSISESLCTHTALGTHNTNNCRIIIIDRDNNLIGTKNADGDFAGFTCGLLNVENLKFTDGTVATTSPVVVELINPAQLNKNGQMFPLDFIDDLINPIEAVIAKVVATTSKVTITVLAECDGSAISGLLTADFSFKKTSDGSAQTITAAEVPAGSGTYELSGTSLAGGTIALRAMSLLTIVDTLPVEAEAIVITVP